jgi:hypothetical protein
MQAALTEFTRLMRKLAQRRNPSPLQLRIRRQHPRRLHTPVRREPQRLPRTGIKH